MNHLATPGQPFPSNALSAVAVDMPSIADGQTAGLRDLAQLVRPRIALMVLVTVFAAIWMTSQPAGINWLPLAEVLFGTALVAASSSIANQILERESDRLMERTASRPIAAGRLSVGKAWSVAALSLIIGAVIIWCGGGLWATLVSIVTWLLYVAVYTPLKRITPLNTAVGAITGGLPVAIGWFAADGPVRLATGDIDGALAVAALGTVLYLWQFPHFMAIAWLYRRQYAAAGLQMLTVVDPSGLRAAGQALAASLAMIPVSLMLAVPSASPRLFLSAAIVSIFYAVVSSWFAFRRDDQSARLLLLTSLGVLLSLMLTVITFGGLVGT